MDYPTYYSTDYEDRHRKEIDELLAVCRNALGAYEALRTLGADKHLLGYDSCLRDLKNAIEKYSSD